MQRYEKRVRSANLFLVHIVADCMILHTAAFVVFKSFAVIIVQITAFGCCYIYSFVCIIVLWKLYNITCKFFQNYIKEITDSVSVYYVDN